MPSLKVNLFWSEMIGFESIYSRFDSIRRYKYDFWRKIVQESNIQTLPLLICNKAWILRCCFYYFVSKATKNDLEHLKESLDTFQFKLHHGWSLCFQANEKYLWSSWYEILQSEKLLRKMKLPNYRCIQWCSSLKNSEDSFLKASRFVACAKPNMIEKASVEEVRAIVGELVSSMKPLDIEKRVQFQRRVAKA